jgi:serine/threonine protein kinase
MQPASQGGSSEIWQGHHSETLLAVALKLLDTEDPAASLREVATCGRLSHPCIVPILDMGVVDGRAWLASPWLAGGNLRQSPSSQWSELRGLVLSLLDALGHAHARGILHRDVKPDNVLFDPSTGAWRLADFGIARIMHGEQSAVHTMGTPWYMSPEQITGDRSRQRPWSDLYSVACLVWHVATGMPPFTGTLVEVLEAQQHKAPPVFTPRFAVPDGLEAWLRVLMRKKPEARASYAADAAAVFRQLEAPVEAFHSTSGPLDTDDTYVVTDLRPRAPETASGIRMPAAPPCELPPLPADDLQPELSDYIVAMRYPRIRRERLETLWSALQQVRATSHSRTVAIPDADVAMALVQAFGVTVSETGQAWVLYLPANVPIWEAVLVALAMPSEPVPLAEGLAERFDIPWDQAAPMAARLLDADLPTVAEICVRVSQERVLVVLAPAAGDCHATLFAAMQRLDHPVLCVQHGAPIGEPLPIDPFTEEELLAAFAATSRTDPHRLADRVALGFRAVRRLVQADARAWLERAARGEGTPPG